MIKLAFLASNNGSSLRAIVTAIETGELSAAPVIVISNRMTAPALDFARHHGIVARCIPTVSDPSTSDERLTAALAAAKADLVILSGYLRKLGPVTLQAFAGRILNVHPALLPRHGGAGMYGRRVHEAVIAAGDAVSGASIHLVDGEYDRGAVLARVETPVFPSDTPEALEARVMATEPALFIDTLKRIVSGALSLDRLRISDNTS